VFEPDGGVEIAPRKVVEEAIELADMFVDDVSIEATSEHWDEPPSPSECRVEPGWSELGVWKLKRGVTAADHVWAAVDSCVAGIDGGHGKGAETIYSVLDHLRGIPAGPSR
jgi:hypothetical protein